MDSDSEANDSDSDYTGEESNQEDVLDDDEDDKEEEEVERCRFDWQEEETERADRGKDTDRLPLHHFIVLLMVQV